MTDKVTHEPPEAAVNRYLADAMAGLAGVDAHLAGSRPTKWVLVIEHGWPEEEDRHESLSVFKSGSLAPWARLGLLRFATLTAEDDVRSLYYDDEEDDGEDDE